MDPSSFKPAGSAMAAVLAGLAADPALANPQALAEGEAALRAAAEREAAEALGEAIARFEPSEALGEPVIEPYSDVPFGA